MLKKKRKTIFITGAGSGIGRATALLFARNGWFVALADIQPAPLEQLADDIGTDNCCRYVMDVTNTRNVADVFGLAGKQRSNQLHVLFNCAAILKMGPHHEMDIRDQHAMVDVNLKGILNCIHAGFGMLRQTRGARIINMSSVSSLYGAPELAVYSSTKFAVRGLTEALNIEYAPLGITVCDIAVAYVQTPMVLDAAHKASSVNKLGVRVKPEAVAESVWKSAHTPQLHRQVDRLTKIFSVLARLFPFAAKQVARWGTKTPKKPALKKTG